MDSPNGLLFHCQSVGCWDDFTSVSTMVTQLVLETEKEKKKLVRKLEEVNTIVGIGNTGVEVYAYGMVGAGPDPNT